MPGQSSRARAAAAAANAASPHFHALIRLDGPPTELDAYPAPAVQIDSARLADLVRSAAGSVAYTAPALGSKDLPRRLRFGVQLGARPVTGTADRQEHRAAAPRYCRGLHRQVRHQGGRGSAHRRPARRQRVLATPTATLRQLAGRATFAALTADQDPYCGWSRWLDMLGFRGHLATKHRRYSTTLGRLRQARRDYARRSYARPGDAPADWADQDHERLEETTLVVGSWRFAGMGWLTSGLSRGYLFGLHSSTPDDLGGYFRPDWS